MFLAQRAIRVAISALLLLSSLPTWQHSHSDGNVPHSHVDADDHQHDARGEPHVHQHLTLFGFELTLPVDTDECESDDDQPTYLVQAPSTIEIGSSVSHLVASSVPLCNGFQSVQIVPTFRCITAIAAPLCDSARLERSGVLLI